MVAAQWQSALRKNEGRASCVPSAFQTRRGHGRVKIQLDGPRSACAWQLTHLELSREASAAGPSLPPAAAAAAATAAKLSVSLRPCPI